MSRSLLHSADCLLGPIEDEPPKDQGLRGAPLHMPPNMTHSHCNAFHVWDQDDVIIPMPPLDYSPQASPMLAVIPYIPSFFPTSHSSPAFLHSIPKESEA